MENSTLISILLVFSSSTFGAGLTVGRYYGHKSGVLDGFDKAAKELAPIYEEDIEYYKNKANSSYSLGEEYGKAEASRDCKDQTRIADVICKSDLKEAYHIGQIDGIRSVTVKCGRGK